MSSWKWPFSASSALRSSRCSAQSSASGASRAANGAKLSEMRSKPCSRAHRRVSQTSHSLKPFGVVAQARHRRERQRRARRADGEVEESRGRPSGAEADDEHRVLVLEPEQRVERHHESALRLAAAPVAGDRLELGAERRARSRPGGAHGTVARRAQPVHGLAHLADRAALERERADVEHRLVAVVERPQPMRAVEREAALRRAEDRDPPAAGVRERDERVDEAVNAAGGPIGSPETIATPPTTR